VAAGFLKGLFSLNVSEPRLETR